MTLRVSVFIAASLDGYIARADGLLDWLDAANQRVPQGEDCGYALFMESVDVLVMGRKTYEKVLSFGEWPYAKPVVVLSRRALEIPPALVGKVSHASLSPNELCKNLSESGVRRLYVDGGYTIQQFLSEGLVTDITLTTIPILLGGGVPLFGHLKKDISLKHHSTKAYDFGFVQSTYLLGDGEFSFL